jgi:hypothetical protein
MLRPYITVYLGGLALTLGRNIAAPCKAITWPANEKIFNFPFAKTY